MRKVRLAVTTGTVATVAGGLVMVVLISGTTAPTASAASPACVATLSGHTDQNGPITLDAEQRGIVGQIISIGKQRQLPPRAWQIAIQAGKVESKLRNLGHGHADSLGVFQIRGMHGSKQERQDVDWQVNWFYDTLTALPNWKTMRPGDAAQAVERSAYPDRYHQWEDWAVSLVKQFADVSNTDLTGCDPSDTPESNQYAGKAIEYARAQIGSPYKWGAEGPSRFDCSGLMQAAYEHAGLSIPRTSRDQYHAGTHVPVDNARPGDLIFWADSAGTPEAIHHVALYIGNNRVVQAPQTGETVKISTIWQDQLVPMATRPA